MIIIQTTQFKLCTKDYIATMYPYPSFSKYILKEVVLELLVPICKREKSGIHSCGFFLLEISLSVLDGGGDRLSTGAFLL